ncbi:MAG TPA: DNA polymerase III subunit chi [Gammaproteobacteria bacterium]|mgnify:FL=1|jgi:DNA polymerase-3 subunit chi|nr:DNA polymerase III subunit chi [Gammaproteobacteria bacterium]
MTAVRIDFYVLEADATDGRLRLACKIIDRAYRSGHTAYLWARDDHETDLLDDLLWTFSQNSFVPHSRNNHNSDLTTPVHIGHHPPQSGSAEVVVSVADRPVEDYSNFLRIAEVVGFGEAEKQSGRSRFKFYRDQGLELETHRITL